MVSPRPYQLALVTPPATEPLTLAEAKLFLRVDGSTDDTLISSLITSARIAAEQYMKRSLIEQTWKLTYDDYVTTETRLLMMPIQSVTSVTIVARDDTATVVDESTYYLSANKEILIFDATPFGHKVEIVYVAGYGDASDIPGPIKQGMLVHIAALYHQRSQQMDIPEYGKALYAPYRIIRF